MNIEALPRSLDRLPFRKAAWLFLPAFALHVAEEAPQFTAWVNRYASAEFTHADFIQNNALGMAMGLVLCSLISLWKNRAIVFLFFVSSVYQAFFNLFFHAGETALHGTYCPGVISSVMIYPPLCYYLTRLAYRDGLLSNRAGIAAFVLAGLIHICVVANQVYFVRL